MSSTIFSAACCAVSSSTYFTTSFRTSSTRFLLVAIVCLVRAVASLALAGDAVKGTSIRTLAKARILAKETKEPKGGAGDQDKEAEGPGAGKGDNGPGLRNDTGGPCYGGGPEGPTGPKDVGIGEERRGASVLIKNVKS